MKRRTFLLGSSASLVSTQMGRPTVQRLEAQATAFYAQPDGRSALVRFTAHRLDAPAARLRVFGPGRRLLGTAGMLPAGETLYGELWVPLEREITVTSELEAPGLRGVHRTSHRLRPSPRWTIHWLRIRDPESISRELAMLPSIRSAVHGALLRATGTLGNPASERDANALIDHVEFLRQGAAAHLLAERIGIPSAHVAALDDLTGAWPTLPMALAGSGVRAAIVRANGGEPHRWWQAPDGSRVLVIHMGPGASSDALEFSASVGAMAGRIGRWIEGLAGNPAITVVLDTAEDERAVAKLRNVEEWNRRFAFPRLVIGDGESLVERLQIATGTSITVTSDSVDSRPPAGGAAVREEAQWLQDADRHRLDRSLAVVGRAVGVPPGAGSNAVLTALAANVNTEFPGVLVFNPTPFGRSDIAIMPDGTPYVVTDVPGLGYAYVPDAVWRDYTPVATRPPISIELDRRTGAIASLRTANAEWVAAGTDGLNAMAGSILEGLEQESVSGVGTRMIAQRWSPVRGVVRSTVTVYHALPFVDVENDADAPDGEPMEYYFHWRLSDAAVAWDIPGGYEERLGLAWRIHALRWMRASSIGGSALLASADAHHGRFLPPATVVSVAPPGRCRLRLGVSETGAGPRDSWAFGYGIQPLRTVPVAGGGSRLPRFASLFDVAPDEVIAVGVEPSGDDDATLYLLNVTNQSRFVSVSYGALRFTSARLVDFLGRDVGPVAGRLEDGVLINVPARGAAAVKVEGVGLNG